MKQLSLAKPHLLIMTGVPGSGKSFFAEKFSETFHAPFVSFHHIENLTDNTEAAVIFGDYMLSEILKTGQSALVEGKSDTRRERVELAKRAREAGYEPLYVWVQTDPETAKTRSGRGGKNKTHRQLGSDEHDRLSKRFSPLHQTEKHVVISGKHTYPSQAKVVLTKLSSPRAEISSHRSAPVRGNQSSRRNITIR